MIDGIKGLEEYADKENWDQREDEDGCWGCHWIGDGDGPACAEDSLSELGVPRERDTVKR